MNANKAIFWDRDGVLNYVIERRADGKQNASPQRFEDFKLIAGVPQILREVRLRGFLNIVATKQPDIARGFMSWEELNKMHQHLKFHIPHIHAIYVCPHDDSDNCNCRKPKPGLLLDASRDHNLNLADCYMVGDSQSDIDAAKNAGVKSILIKTDYNQEIIGQAFTIKVLSDILGIIS